MPPERVKKRAKRARPASGAASPVSPVDLVPAPMVKSKSEKSAEGIKLVEIDYTRLKARTATIQLQEITLMGVSLTSHVDPRTLHDSSGPWEYSLSLFEARWARSDTQLDIGFGYRVQTSAQREDQRTPIFTVTARFLAHYFVPPGTGVLENDVVADWVAANGQINVFPYLRQLVSDLSGRAGFPPLVLKVLRAPANRPADLIQRVDAVYSAT